MRIAQPLRIFLFAAAVLLWALAQAWAQPLFGPTQDPLAGSRAFGSKGCSKCHAINGVGGQVGPDLGHMPGPRSFYDLAAAMWNHFPRMAEQMRKLGISRPQLSPRETGDLIAFLYTLNYFDRPGNKQLGRQLFTKKQCVSCHQLERKGGVVGPSLDSLGQFSTPIFVATAMWNHGPTMAEAMRVRGIKRPTFSGSELRDLLTYLNSVSLQRGEGQIHVLPGRPAVGKELFVSRRCIACHTIKGRGGQVGGELAERGLQRSLVQFAAAMWNKEPAMLNEMKKRDIPAPQLQADEMADIVAYLYSVQYFARPGDPRKGQESIKTKFCLNCHSVRGKGGKIAPAFEAMKGLDHPTTIISAMWNHASTMEQKMKQESLKWPVLKGEEMADIAAYFEVLSRRQQ